MVETVDYAIPVSSIIRRLDNACEQLRKERKALPWWAWWRKIFLDGAIAALRVESEHVTEVAGQWQPIWNILKQKS